MESIDIDASPEKAAHYKVDAVPTYLVLDDSGREIDRTSDAQSAAGLARFYADARARAGSSPVWRGGSPRVERAPAETPSQSSDRLDRVDKRVAEMMRKLDLLLERAGKDADSN